MSQAGWLRTSSPRRDSFLLLLGLLSTSVVLRLPSILWPFTINMDENTFLVVAQRTLHGELPYTTTFDNKSPLAVIFETISLALVGPNQHALRLIAALMVGLTAFFLVTSAPTVRLQVPAYVTGLLFIALWGVIPDGLAWMNELNAALVFAVGFLLVTKHQTDRWWRVVLAGAVVGVLPLIRINWAPVAVCLAIGFALRVRSSRTIGQFVAGAVLPTVLVAGAYGAAGEMPRLWLGAVTLPRMLAGQDGAPLPSLRDDQLPVFWLLILVITTAALVTNMQLDRARGRKTSPIDWLILSSVWALTVAAVIQPFDWTHQTLQILPFLVLAIGRLAGAAPRYQRATVVPVMAACLSVLYWFAIDVLPQYDWRRQSADEAAVTAAVAAIPGLESKALWVPGFQAYLHWRLDKPPLTPIATHPPLLWDQGAQQTFFGKRFSTSEATQLAFDLNPDVIVAEVDFLPPWADDAAKHTWSSTLQRDYQKVTEVSGRVIWQKTETP